jgi:hypothetical protein
MHEEWAHQMEAWHEFFLLIGTAGFTLTGLLFVVVSFGSRTVATSASTGVRAFVSPNVVHLSATLVVAAVLLIPHVSAAVVGLFLCSGALASLGYLAYTKVHRRWRENKLSLLDWVWFVGLPTTVYVVLFLSGVGLLLGVVWSMYGTAVALILLLVIGIRNAWDLVIWMAEQEHR